METACLINNMKSPKITEIGNLFFLVGRIEPTIKSTWVTGSVGIKESLLSREPVKVTIGDNVRLFTKTKVKGSRNIHVSFLTDSF